MSKSRLYAIWYACIALGFFLLGVYRELRLNGRGVVIHMVIAAGFAALSGLQFRSKN
jgi:hypothetical protein